MNHDNNSIPPPRKLITRVVKAGTVFTEAISLVVKEEKITMQQFNVLRILRGRKGKPASLQDVSKDMLHSNSNTTRVVDKLVAKELAERIQCKNDRRQIEITITDSGLKLLARLDEKVDHRERELVEALSEKEIKLLIETLSKLS
ncbi:DNA-binding transcriptional regulator, MarR family [Nonlabens sp. Hel1_33_55]|uniref:MarR family winged helix-turn-helix transcriptional regulator n=1 Tax=Nonlabens sp. Hel1_33_55 TaxID=1336802 RepID=UPI000875E4C1|nr:MarR family transcriptional regulator [Nonlabens sp. Hel1_33_55]SCX97151.1 DNA-binding transcriptional regulator, MarR family [Nonlabens sp. Hel1_33_55]